MVRVRPLILILAMVIVAGPSLPSAQSQPSPAAVNVEALGPQVGARVPDFTLPDQSGRQQSLSTLSGPKGLMLVFNRSADW
jgi:cytochrome oxidase Cu insertion factor (SCO1/SenC/PrrC family)